MFINGIFNGRTRHILKPTRIPTGVLIDENLTSINKVIVPNFSIGDSFLVIYIQKLFKNGNVSITILNVTNSIRDSVEFKET